MIMMTITMTEKPKLSSSGNPSDTNGRINP